MVAAAVVASSVVAAAAGTVVVGTAVTSAIVVGLAVEIDVTATGASVVAAWLDAATSPEVVVTVVLTGPDFLFQESFL